MLVAALATHAAASGWPGSSIQSSLSFDRPSDRVMTQLSRPEAAGLARRGRRSDRRNIRRIQGEQAGQIPKDSRKRGELQTFPILNACNASLTTSLRGRWEPSQASERAF